MYIVVVGAGRIGSRVIEHALEDGHDVAVFDKDRERCNLITKRYDVVAYHADATHEASLEEADTERADAVIAATRQDPVNLMIVAIARRLGVAKRISVLNNPSAAPLYEERGAHVVANPSALAAEHLLHAARHPGVEAYTTVGRDVQLFQVYVHADSDVDGKALKEAGLPAGVVVAAIEREERFVMPRGETLLEAGDRVTLLGNESLMDTALARFREGTGRGL